jgi:futalosine hydrolase
VSEPAPELRGFLPVHAAAVEGAALEGLGVRALGVGKTAAAVALAELLAARRPAGVLLFGVCGAYPARHRPAASLAVGELCFVDPDAFADEGAATPGGFRDLAALGLGEVGPWSAAPVTAALARRLGAPVVRGATVSTCSGTEALSAAHAERSGAHVETMEGAAAALVCARAEVPFVQLRAVSNWTGDRTRGGWDLPAALAALHAAVRRLLAPA